MYVRCFVSGAWCMLTACKNQRMSGKEEGQSVFTCLCSPDYIGDRCETSMYSRHVTILTKPVGTSAKTTPIANISKARYALPYYGPQGLKNGFFVSVRTSATGKRTSAECEMDKKYSVRIFFDLCKHMC